MLLIKNGMLTDWTGERKADMLIENGLISQIDDHIDIECETIDAAGQFVLPAFIDLHCHLRNPGQSHKEEIKTGLFAAVAGGFTTLNLMANTNPVCSTLEIAEAVVNACNEIGICDVYQCLSVTKDFDGKTIELSCLNDDKKGIVKFLSEDGKGISDSFVFSKGLEESVKYGRQMLIHAEDAAFSKTDMAAAEDLETIRDLYLIERSRAKAHFCHVSTEASAKAITDAAKRGVNVSYEVAPHHLLLNDETEFCVNPPLRKESDRRYLIEMIKQGNVLAIATDHAPHTAEDKKNGAPGMVGLETAFSVSYTALCKNEGIKLSVLSKLMSKKPAALLGINKGELKVGRIADLVLVSEEKVKISASTFKSKGRNTPFDGMELFGKVIATIKGGRVINDEL